MVLSETQKKELYEKVEKIVEKYKDRPLLFSKITTIANTLKQLPYGKSKIYSDIAKLTAKINYNCGFKDGKCKRRKEKQCCCEHCRSNVGYLRMRFFDGYDTDEFIEKELLYYAKKFSKNTGFWREGKGCNLPRERRSSTCLGYNCIRNVHRTIEEKLLLNLLYDYDDIIRDRHDMPRCIKGVIKMLKEHFLYREE